MVSTQTKLRGVGRAILSYCVSSCQFGDDSLDLRLCRIFKLRMSYDNLRYCVTRTSHTQLRVGPLPDEETYTRRVYLWTENGFCIAVRVEDMESFVEELQRRASHVEIRRKPTMLNSITLAREEKLDA